MCRQNAGKYGIYENKPKKKETTNEASHKLFGYTKEAIKSNEATLF